MTYPTAWHRVAAPVLHRLTLGDAIALSSRQEPAGRLVVGITHPATGSPLPADFLSATLPGSPAPELVHLGPHRFARVLDPRLSLHSASSSIYALAAGPRAVVGVCQTASQSFVVACERALGTLQIAAPPPDPRRAYARSLNRVLRALDHARAVHGRALAQASTAVAQAAAADDLASDDGHSAASVARLAAGKAAAENAGLAGALRRGAAAYAALAGAAEQGDTVAYARAQRAVSAANAAAESALQALTRLGYQVG
jgi:hypothetical protein